MTGARVLLLVALAVAGSVAAQSAEETLASIPFEDIIGKPLMAVVRAQTQAATTTLNFINDIGFVTDSEGTQTTRMMEFGYTGLDSAGNERDGHLVVPLLSVLPIPYLRFETVELEFSVQITATESTKSESSSSTTTTRSTSSHSFWGGNDVNTKATTSSKSESKSSATSTTSYTTRVLVQAAQAEMPEGMSKVLDKMLELAIAATAAKASTTS